MWKSEEEEEGAESTADGRGEEDMRMREWRSLDVDLMVTAWFSDCFYWVADSRIWSKNGVEVTMGFTMGGAGLKTLLERGFGICSIWIFL